MNIEDYKNLYEIQSLDLKVKEHLDLISDEERRIVFMENQEKKRKEQYQIGQEKLRETKEITKKLEKELFSIQQELDRANKHLNEAQNQQQATALETEIQNLSPKAMALEEEIFSLMEKEEEISATLKTDEDYLAGVVDTINDIKKEVSTFVSSEQAKIKVLDERIAALFENTHPDLVTYFNRSRSKHRFTGSLSTIQGSGCVKCKYVVPSLVREQVERMTAIEMCSGCGRLLAPLNSRL
ncbi:hypothetical protein M899_3259 [Bacteriovorax sp. BSW11_IV]|uniref:zinc ribbon domain-containing protein n=1 Tax=Bacteriovorax sp. BSW11_IV TaxID=1353529 RepID=UPI00038A059E|nr:hypothetical protein [Bacteriovorax sp. BSW11_IV]EQC48299.1 hypothetical protein M899_3259 [Bacteriovorax sp. BSW11_IV]